MKQNTDYRMYKQAFETVKGKSIKHGDIVQPYNMKVLTDGTSPTLTSRPEGFKTCILVIIKKNPG